MALFKVEDFHKTCVLLSPKSNDIILKIVFLNIWLKSFSYFNREHAQTLFWSILKLQRAVVTLNIRSMSSKSNLQTMYICKFGGENTLGQKTELRKG